MKINCYYHRGTFLYNIIVTDERYITNDPSKDMNVYWFKLTDEQIMFLHRFPDATLQDVVRLAFLPLDHDTTERMRSNEYTKSDCLFIAWKRHDAMGLVSKAHEYKEKWLEATAKIEGRYPYGNS